VEWLLSVKWEKSRCRITHPFKLHHVESIVAKESQTLPPQRLKGSIATATRLQGDTGVAGKFRSCTVAAASAASLQSRP
jgi:hypothetical protein